MDFNDEQQNLDNLELMQDMVIRGKTKKQPTPPETAEPGPEADKASDPVEAGEAAPEAEAEPAAEAASEPAADEAAAEGTAESGVKAGKSVKALWNGLTRKQQILTAVLALVVLALLIFLICRGSSALKERRLMEAATADYSDGETILPNVWVGDVKVSGMTRAEATEAVKDMAEETLMHTITVHLPDRDVVFTTELHSLDADVSAAVDEACSYGRDDSSLRALYAALEASEDKEKRIPFVTDVTWDDDYIQKQLEGVAAEIAEEPVENDVEINTDELYIKITKGADGQELDTAALQEQIDHAFETADYDDITFAYTALPIEDVDLSGLYAKYTIEPVSAEYDVESGEVTDSSVGYAPDTPVYSARYDLETAEKGDVLTLTFHEVEPDMTTEELSSMLFRDTLYSYGSVYASNANRTENLRLACAAINGTVIQPGDVFSFNDTVGERTVEKGYKSATVYVSGDSVSQTGGGICQVASTIYYCCLYSELEIVAREPHMYKVTYVPYGMDATVYWGSLDFKFRNNTDYPIKINAYLANGRCYIELIGTDVNHHNVELESVALSSLKYEVYRYVYDEDGNLLKKEDIGTSSYSAHKS